MSTDTTKQIVALLLARFKNYVPPTGSKLSVALTEIYVTQAPDNAVFPYGVMSLTRQQTAGFSGFRETWQVELQLYGSPRSEQWVVEGAADVADQAMLTWEDRTDGVVFGGYRSRWTLPVFPDAADRELVRVRCLYEVGVWPDLFTQHVP